MTSIRAVVAGDAMHTPTEHARVLIALGEAQANGTVLVNRPPNFP